LQDGDREQGSIERLGVELAFPNARFARTRSDTERNLTSLDSPSGKIHTALSASIKFICVSKIT